MKQYADFEGRARRTEYWMFTLFNFIFSLVLTGLDTLLGFSNGLGTGVLSGIYSLVVLVPSIAVGVRRLHDLGKSGWKYLYVLIPIVGAIMLLVWFCTEGERHENAYGPDPKAGE